jgi:hypothetical protein
MKMRPATREDIIALTGKPPETMMRAFVAEHDGEVLAVGGLYYCDGSAIAFSTMADKMRTHRKSIMRYAVKLTELFNASAVPVRAICSGKEANAPAFLERLGFVPERQSAIGDIYIWGAHGST